VKGVVVMSHEAHADPPKLAKALSDHDRDLYVAAGWTVMNTFRDENGNPYEYILAWKREGMPVRPNLPWDNRRATS
jgi:hypothetical protein